MCLDVFGWVHSHLICFRCTCPVFDHMLSEWSNSLFTNENDLRTKGWRIELLTLPETKTEKQNCLKICWGHRARQHIAFSGFRLSICSYNYYNTISASRFQLSRPNCCFLNLYKLLAPLTQIHQGPWGSSNALAVHLNWSSHLVHQLSESQNGLLRGCGTAIEFGLCGHTDPSAIPLSSCITFSKLLTPSKPTFSHLQNF